MIQQILQDRALKVKVYLRTFCPTFKEQVERRVAFYRSSTLVRRGLLLLRRDPRYFRGEDLGEMMARMDRRMLDWIVGLDTEINELVEGSDLCVVFACVAGAGAAGRSKLDDSGCFAVSVAGLGGCTGFARRRLPHTVAVAPRYTPKVDIAQVVLPEDLKAELVRQVATFDQLQLYHRTHNLKDVLPSTGGLVMLFHGPSGTGKTMMANALAAHLGKR